MEIKEYIQKFEGFLTATNKYNKFEEKNIFVLKEIEDFNKLVIIHIAILNKYTKFDEAIASHVNNYKPFNDLNNLILKSNFDKITDFDKLVITKQSLINKHPNLKKYITHFLDTYNYNTHFNYLHLENNIKQLELFENLVTTNKTQISNFNTIEIELINYISTFNFNNILNTTPIKNQLTELNLLFDLIQNKLTPLVSKLRNQVNRYNSYQACNDSEILISNARKKMKLNDIANVKNNINQQINALSQIDMSIQNDLKNLSLIHQNLARQNIWNEDFNTLNSKIQICIQNFHKSIVSINAIESEINTCISNKSVYINGFVKRYSSTVNNFTSLVQVFLNQPCSKKQFDSWIKAYQYEDNKAKLIKLVRFSSILFLAGVISLYITDFNIIGIYVSAVLFFAVFFAVWYYFFKKNN